ncbi:hypothetical protein GGTG_11240 [Gaeumannomyces tritici R3-111a-1]|uniref:Uncharacterized protein n=1 Tax=Gaeumannomyces tritici (strain R3-111a-1) TaxID=644352 RepID=J3PCM0_GAET3|nr:hypothetical protein GGTG_11240 [Gaeumannomyces tritici R3-111a-1]EJT71990.1 hypothetical protein GGTG_11240 [Gaeumannomyces tritici R3-111a-1]
MGVCASVSQKRTKGECGMRPHQLRGRARGGKGEVFAAATAIENGHGRDGRDGGEGVVGWLAVFGDFMRLVARASSAGPDDRQTGDRRAVPSTALTATLCKTGRGKHTSPVPGRGAREGDACGNPAAIQRRAVGGVRMRVAGDVVDSVVPKQGDASPSHRDKAKGW